MLDPAQVPQSNGPAPALVLYSVDFLKGPEAGHDTVRGAEQHQPLQQTPVSNPSL